MCCGLICLVVEGVRWCRWILFIDSVIVFSVFFVWVILFVVIWVKFLFCSSFLFEIVNFVLILILGWVFLVMCFFVV